MRSRKTLFDVWNWLIGLCAPLVLVMCVLAWLFAGAQPDHGNRVAAQDLRPSPAASSSTLASLYLPWLGKEADLAPPHRLKFGFQFAMEDFPEQHADDLRLELPRGRELGLRSVRARLFWDHVEPVNTSPADFDWSATDERFAAYTAWGYDLMVQLIAFPEWATVYPCGYDLLPGMEAEWRQFVRAAVERYGEANRVVAWEIGNEPDGRSHVIESDWDRPEGWGRGEPKGPYGGCWAGRADRYVHFLSLAYDEIKAVDPEAIVTYGGLAYTDHEGDFDKGFLADFMAAGGGAYFDVINYHWFPNVTSHNPGRKHHREQLAIIASHGVTGRPVWLTETTRLTQRGKPESEAWQIEYLTRQLPEMLTFSEIERVYFYGWTDFPDDVSDGFGTYQRGFVRNDHQPKVALPLIPKLIEAVRGRPERLDVGTGVTAWRFRAPRATQDTVIAWPADAATGGATGPGSGGGGAEGDVATHARFPVPTGRTLEVERFTEEAIMSGECCPVERPVSERGRVYVELRGEPAVWVRMGRR